MPAKTLLAGDKMDAPAKCAIPFRPYCGGVLTRTRNVSEYMLVLAVCLVNVVVVQYVLNFYLWLVICADVENVLNYHKLLLQLMLQNSNIS